MAGKRGESIMVAPFPEPDESRIDTGAEAEVEMVKTIVNSARNLRSTMGLSPAAKVPLYIAEHAPSLERHRDAIAAITRASFIQFVATLPAIDAPAAVTAAGKLMLHVEVDVAAERLRLSKELERLASDLEKQRAKLGNASFAERAPPAVVEQARKLLADTEARHADLRTQLVKLG
jgi:valyl-tRNA synthetase